jgi:hypothetical protein
MYKEATRVGPSEFHQTIVKRTNLKPYNIIGGVII